jgi:Cu-Zn family superoxide dismutase
MLTVLLAATALLGARALRTQQRADAAADLRDADGRTVGRAEVRRAGSGLALHVEVRGLAPGAHAIHLHAVGSCEGAGFTGAGGHLNPDGRQHGIENPAGAHAGDLPNLAVGTDSVGRADMPLPAVTLAGGPRALIDGDGSAFVIHAYPDDNRSDPAGNSGPRIACGVFRALPLAPRGT